MKKRAKLTVKRVRDEKILAYRYYGKGENLPEVKGVVG
jgi:hypothetical protein